MNYQLQCIKLNNPFKQYSHPDFHGAPTYLQFRMMDAVTKALKADIFYNTEVLSFVSKELSLIAPQSWHDAHEKDNEGGAFGMDIYYARKAIESISILSSNKDTLNKLVSLGKLEIGTKIKDFRTGTHRFSNMIVTSFNTELGNIAFRATKRGSKNHWNLTLGANRVDLLSKLIDNIEDDEITSSSDGICTTYTINIGKNNRRELFPLLL